MQYFLIIIFILGCLIGSFLNVLIDRLPVGKNPWKGRSKCDFCKKTLSPYDLIPVISFVLLKGKCRYCHKQLSVLYPLIELATGIIFVGIFIYTISNFQFPIYNQIIIINYQLSIINFLSLIIIFSSFLVIFVADLKYQIIPDELLVSLFVGIVLFIIGKAGFNINYLINIILSGVGAAGFFLFFYLITKGNGMGFGDVKLAFFLGLLLGFPSIATALYISFMSGALVSIILVITKKKKLRQKIAFGPFLITGTVITFFLGNYLLSLYRGLFF